MVERLPPGVRIRIPLYNATAPLAVVALDLVMCRALLHHIADHAESVLTKTAAAVLTHSTPSNDAD